SSFMLIFTNTQDKEQEIYRQQRAQALDALGWTLFQTRRSVEAESWLRQSIKAHSTEKSLRHLATTLRELGHNDEAAKLTAEAETKFVESVRKGLVSQRAENFQITSISGRQYSLEHLKGKIVLLNFWATWCGPCLQEMRHLRNLYDKYKDKGLEILSVSTDEYSYKVQPMVTKLKVAFPVFVDSALGEHFNSQTIPLNIFIDRQGMIRYRKIGFDMDSEREFEIILTELLKQ